MFLLFSTTQNYKRHFNVKGLKLKLMKEQQNTERT